MSDRAFDELAMWGDHESVADVLRRERDEARVEVERLNRGWSDANDKILDLTLALNGAPQYLELVTAMKQRDAERARAEALEGALRDLMAKISCACGDNICVHKTEEYRAARDALAKHGRGGKNDE